MNRWTCSIMARPNIRPHSYLSMLPWIFPGAPLKVNGAPGKIQGVNRYNRTALSLDITVIMTSQITSNSTVCSATYSGWQQRGQQSIFLTLWEESIRFSSQRATVWCDHQRACFYLTQWSNFTWWYRPLTHWGRVTHICVSKPTTIG